MKKLILTCIVTWLTLAAFQVRAAASDACNAILGKHTPDIYGYLDSRGFKHVGVLPFPVKSMAWRGATIQRNLAARLEQALVANMDHVVDEQHTKVVFDAWDQARSKDPKAGMKSPQDRARLFRLPYKTPIKGEQPIRLDALVMGAISHENSSTVKLTLWYCTPTKPDWQQLKFDPEVGHVLMFEADSHTLASMGRGFCVDKKFFTSRSGIRTNVKNADILAALRADDSWNERQDKNQRVDQPEERIQHKVDSTWTEQTPVELEIRFDGQLQPFHRDQIGGAMNMTIADPEAGQTVEMRMNNVADERLYVVVSVNGINTLYGEPVTDPVHAAKWVLEPHQSYQVRGIYNRNGGVTELKGHSEYDSNDAMTSGWMQRDMEGLIHMYVYRKMEEPLTNAPSKRRYQASLLDDNMLSLGFDFANVRGGKSVTALGTFARDSSTATADSWMKLGQRIADRVGRTVSPRGFMLPSGKTKSATLTKMSVGNVDHIATLIVRYYSVAQRP